MEKNLSCPVCSKSDFSAFLNCKDHLVSRETFKIASCNHCGLKITTPFPKEEDIAKYYESEEYISHSNSKRGLMNFLYQIARNYTISRKIKLIKSLTGNDKIKILDIGCGTGEFLSGCQKSGWIVSGTEPNSKARMYAKTKYEISLYEKESSINNTFDVITMWHVLEHTKNLGERILSIKKLLKDSGTIIIAVPNYLCYEAHLYSEFWAAYDVPRHLYHFTPNTITMLMHNYGFNIKKTLPMKLDAFYISMLSEKNKYGKINYFRAFINGMKSNLKASKDKNYSSLIYVIQKAL